MNIGDIFKRRKMKTEEIERIELIPHMKMCWPTYYQVQLKSGERLDLLPFEELKLYQSGDKIEYKVDQQGIMAWKEHPGIPLYMKNISLEERCRK